MNKSILVFKESNHPSIETQKVRKEIGWHYTIYYYTDSFLGGENQYNLYFLSVCFKVPQESPVLTVPFEIGS